MGRKLARSSLFVAAGAVLGVVACNAAVGGGVVALVGGAGYLAGQCYDRVRVKVRDADSGRYTCDAEVSVSDGDSERPLRPCYSAALTEGKWRFTARQAGYTEASTELQIAEVEGDCPHYTHSIELTLRREGAAPVTTTLTPARGTGAAPIAPTPPPATTPSGAGTAPGAPATPPPPPSVPTRSFDALSPPSADAGAQH
jgi:hypothetical protein